jgi:hypothetical protein
MAFKGSGLGDFNYSTVDEAIAAIPESFNLVNPPLRGKITPTLLSSCNVVLT